MELSKDVNKIPVMSVPGTPVKSKQFLKFYVRRKSIKLLNNAQDIDGSEIFPQLINDSGKPEFKENYPFIQGTPVKSKQFLKFYVRRKSIKLLNNAQDIDGSGKPEFKENYPFIQGTPVKSKQFLKFYVRRKSIKLLNNAQDIDGSGKPEFKENYPFIQGTPVKSKQFLKFYVRRKSIKLLNNAQDIDGSGKPEFKENYPFIQGTPVKSKQFLKFYVRRKSIKLLNNAQDIDGSGKPEFKENYPFIQGTPVKSKQFLKFYVRRKSIKLLNNAQDIDGSGKPEFKENYPFIQGTPVKSKQFLKFYVRRKSIKLLNNAQDIDGSGKPEFKENYPFIQGTPVKSKQFLKFYVRRKSIKLLNNAQDIDGSGKPEFKENYPFIQGTPVKSKQFLKFYVRRKSIKLLNNAQDIDGSGKPEFKENYPFIQVKDDSQRVHGKEEKKNSKEESERKCEESEILQEKEERKNLKGAQKKQRFHRPRIMEEGKKPRNPATTRLRTISKKRKKNDKDSEDEVIPEPRTPEKQSIPKRRKKEKTKKLKINKRVTTLIKSSKKLVTAKVNLDPETIKEWELLMVNDLPNRSYVDNETEAKWKREREILQSRIDLFISRMHLLQGNRKFQQWKGSVVDSVVGVFLTQNVSDYLSSNAFMSVAAKFPTDARRGLEGLAYHIEEPQDINDSIDDDHRPNYIGNDDGKSSEFITLHEDSIPEVEEHKKTAKRKNEKTGIMEDEIVDWKALRRMYTKEGSRHKMHMDTVNWNDVRLSGQQVFATTIKKRGQFRILARRILKFLSDEVKQNGTVDLEWLRNAPSDLVKRYLLEIEGIGLKSAECVRLLGIKHSAFPVDTNVGRIAVRLGWVPLEPLPKGVQMHQLHKYPSMDAIQKYLWPRLCKLPQETLYELHYQMITFGKVFCTKVIPNCNECPMKSECKYFASAYVSSKILLEGPEEKTHEEKTHESDFFMDAYSQDADADMMTSNINLIEECASPGCSEQDTCCKPMVEFPSSPRAEEIPELMDIEDAPRRCTYEAYAKIPEIDIDMNALKKNVEDALVEGGKMLNDSDDEISKALAVLTPENACIPIKLPQKIKYYDRLRTEHVVYVLPDNHELLRDFERRELDDPSPYLLAIWQPGETSYSFTPPKKKCNSDGSNLCKMKTCSYCWSLREQSSNIFRGTILIPCRTAMRGGFPLNGTYFQTNEVFADHETSLKPIKFPREWCEGLEKRALYCGSTVTSIFRFLDTRRIQLCFWTGFLCMRAFDRKQRNPEELVRRLHTPPAERGAKFMKDDDF